MATSINAKIIGLERKIGSIEAGKYADFIVVKRNPMNNLKSLQTPEMVYMNGNKVYCKA